MMITERQEKLLDFLISEYISTAEPVSSFALKKCTKLNVSPATVRNDLQELTKKGYIKQLHTSGGRVPTKKAYKHFSEKITSQIPEPDEIFFCGAIFKEIEITRKEIESQMKMLEQIFLALDFSRAPGQETFFEILNIVDTWHKKNKI